MGARKRRVRGARTMLARHTYVGDGVEDHRGRDRCRDCRLGEDHVVHQLDPVDPEVTQLSHRITGEREEDE